MSRFDYGVWEGESQNADRISKPIGKALALIRIRAWVGEPNSSAATMVSKSRTRTPLQNQVIIVSSTIGALTIIVDREPDSTASRPGTDHLGKFAKQLGGENQSIANMMLLLYVGNHCNLSIVGRHLSQRDVPQQQ